MKVKEKESEITPINVLVKVFLNQQYEYHPYRIIGLRYKHKNKPALVIERGEKIDRWRIKDVLLDTPETREALEQARKLSEQRDELLRKITSIMSITTEVNPEKLHERIIV